MEGSHNEIVSLAPMDSNAPQRYPHGVVPLDSK